MKPLPTLMRPLRSVDLETGEPGTALVERSDVQAVEALAVVAEAAVAWELARAAREKFGGDALFDFVAAHARVPRADRVASNALDDTSRSSASWAPGSPRSAHPSPIGSGGLRLGGRRRGGACRRRRSRRSSSRAVRRRSASSRRTLRSTCSPGARRRSSSSAAARSARRGRARRSREHAFTLQLDVTSEEAWARVSRAGVPLRGTARRSRALYDERAPLYAAPPTRPHATSRARSSRRQDPVRGRIRLPAVTPSSRTRAPRRPWDRTPRTRSRAQDARRGRAVVGSAADRPLLDAGRARRWHDDRPRRLRRGHVHARDRLGRGPVDARRPGGRLHRRQGRHRHRAGEEPRRRVPLARGDGRSTRRSWRRSRRRNAATASPRS